MNEHGNNYYRRKPPKDGGAPFKPPPDKPSDGAKLKNFPKGKMLKAAKITERQTAGKGLRPYLNGAGFQLRVAEAIRNLVALSLPEVKKTIRYKGKNGKPSRPVVDPRLMFALLTMRRENVHWMLSTSGIIGTWDHSPSTKTRVKFPTSASAQKMKLKTENNTPYVGWVRNSKTTKKIVQRPL